jgi:hypothetical protein
MMLTGRVIMKDELRRVLKEGMKTPLKAVPQWLPGDRLFLLCGLFYDC